jgi:hypothetical protein
VAGKLGFKKKGCDKKPENRDGCFFANLKTTLTAGASIKLEGSGSITYACILCGKTTIAVEASFALGDFSWDLTISDVSFNDPECGSGLTGGVFKPGDAKFRIGAKFSGSITKPDGIKRSVDFSKDILGCTLNRETIHDLSKACMFFP